MAGNLLDADAAQNAARFVGPPTTRLPALRAQNGRHCVRGKQGFFQFPVEDYQTINGEFARIQA